MFGGGGEWLPDLSSWMRLEEAVGVVFAIWASSFSYLFYFAGSLIYCDYLYFVELGYVLALAVFLFVLGDHQDRL